MTTQDLELRWAQHSGALAIANSLNKAVVFDALKGAGITHLAVGFDGEGDSGQIDGVTAYAGEATVEFPATTVTLCRVQFGCEESTTHEISLREGVEELCYGYLEQKFGGWENDDGAFGEFVFDVAQRRIALDFNGRFVDHAHHSHSF